MQLLSWVEVYGTIPRGGNVRIRSRIAHLYGTSTNVDLQKILVDKWLKATSKVLRGGPDILRLFA